MYECAMEAYEIKQEQCSAMYMVRWLILKTTKATPDAKIWILLKTNDSR